MEEKFFLGYCGGISLALYKIKPNGTPEKLTFSAIKRININSNIRNGDDDHLEKMARFIAETFCSEWESGAITFAPSLENMDSRIKDLEFLNPEEGQQLSIMIDTLNSGDEIGSVFQKIQRFN